MAADKDPVSAAFRQNRHALGLATFFLFHTSIEVHPATALSGQHTIHRTSYPISHSIKFFRHFFN
jgi:hypothetical protein